MLKHLFLLVFLASGLVSAKPKLVWVAAHGPQVVIDSGVENFKNGVKGNFDVKSKFIDTGYSESAQDSKKIIEMVKNNEAQIAQVFSYHLETAMPEFNIYDLPFLFASYEHAEKYFESDYALNLLNSLDKIGLKGFAYTYSGGYKILCSSEKTERMSDLKNKVVNVSGGGAISRSYFQSLGAVPVAFSKKSMPQRMEKGQINLFETVYPRVGNLNEGEMCKNLIETNHGTQLTILVMSKKYFESLSKKQQKLVSEQLRVAAQHERQFSIAYGKKVKEELVKEGSKIVPFVEQDKLQEVAKDFYKKFPDLINEETYQFIKKLESDKLVSR